VIDYSWQSNGGILLDPTGDILLTEPTGLECLQDMVITRLKAALNGWQLYNIGADLQRDTGNTADAEIEVTIQRQITQSMTNQFLQSGDFTVQTLRDGDAITAFVYINNSLIATAQVQKNQPPTVTAV